jgi:hypothetical protein
MAARLLEGTTRISGPGAYFAYQLPVSRHTLYLFGDFHFSYANQCARCDTDAACKSIVQFIELARRDATANGTTLDVYMEFPYVPAAGRLRDQVLADVHEFFMRDRVNVLTRLFGKQPEYIGIFSLLYRQFSQDLYGPKAPGQTQRFHYSDARQEGNVVRLLTPHSDRWIRMFHRRVPDVRTFRRVLNAFTLGHLSKRSFQEEMGSIFGGEAVVDERTLTSRRPGGRKVLHKIAKQVAKLPADLRAKVEAYVGEKLDALCRVLDEDLRYADGVRFLSSNDEVDDPDDEEITYIRASRLVHYVSIFTIFMTSVVKTIMMDVYLLARMLYYATLPSAERGTSIVYAGAFHTGVYADFLSRYLKLKPLGCHTQRFPVDLSDAEVRSLIQRCIHIDGACDVANALPRAPKARSLLDDVKRPKSPTKPKSHTTRPRSQKRLTQGVRDQRRPARTRSAAP